MTPAMPLLRFSLSKAGLSFLRRNPSYQDSDITFFMHVYYDLEMLKKCLCDLRTHFPRARVVIVSDGDGDRHIAAVAEQFSAEVNFGERLFTLHCGGRILHRMLELFFQKPSRYLLKIDTDTQLHRRFAYLPATDCIFGTLQRNRYLISVQGGFTGFTESAALRLYESAVFLDEVLRDPQKSWAKGAPFLSNCAHRTGLIRMDWVIGFVAAKLGIPQCHFNEVKCNWKVPPENKSLRYAVTHPRADQRVTAS